MPHLSANDPRAALMLRLADRAGEIAMRYFQSADLSVDRKPDESPVTIADREIESALRAAITSAFPDDAILGEEHGELGGASGWRWV
ncbi:MAG: hypothetical protein RLZZ93_1080, partial [Actinomycetota bacterium]